MNPPIATLGAFSDKPQWRQKLESDLIVLPHWWQLISSDQGTLYRVTANRPCRPKDLILNWQYHTSRLEANLEWRPSQLGWRPWLVISQGLLAVLALSSSCRSFTEMWIFAGRLRGFEDWRLSAQDGAEHLYLLYPLEVATKGQSWVLGTHTFLHYLALHYITLSCCESIQTVPPCDQGSVAAGPTVGSHQWLWRKQQVLRTAQHGRSWKRGKRLFAVEFQA